MYIAKRNRKLKIQISSNRGINCKIVAIEETVVCDKSVKLNSCSTISWHDWTIESESSLWLTSRTPPSSLSFSLRH